MTVNICYFVEDINVRIVTKLSLQRSLPATDRSMSSSQENFFPSIFLCLLSGSVLDNSRHSGGRFFLRQLRNELPRSRLRCDYQQGCWSFQARPLHDDFVCQLRKFYHRSEGGHYTMSIDCSVLLKTHSIPAIATWMLSYILRLSNMHSVHLFRRRRSWMHLGSMCFVWRPLAVSTLRARRTWFTLLMSVDPSSLRSTTTWQKRKRSWRSRYCATSRSTTS